MFKRCCAHNRIWIKIIWKKIYNFFIENVNKFNDIIIPPRNKFCDIKIYELDYEQKNIGIHSIKIIGTAEITGVYQNIGPYSGICNISVVNSIPKEINLWDQWCHFERCVVKISGVCFNSVCLIESTNKLFDTSSSKVQNFGVEKFIKPLCIFYIGSINSVEFVCNDK